jgi:hypothetical protein
MQRHPGRRNTTLRMEVSMGHAFVFVHVMWEPKVRESRMSRLHLRGCGG